MRLSPFQGYWGKPHPLPGARASGYPAASFAGLVSAPTGRSTRMREVSIVGGSAQPEGCRSVDRASHALLDRRAEPMVASRTGSAPRAGDLRRLRPTVLSPGLRLGWYGRSLVCISRGRGLPPIWRGAFRGLRPAPGGPAPCLRQVPCRASRVSAVSRRNAPGNVGE